MNETKSKPLFACAWERCSEMWPGSFEKMPIEWGWPSRDSINFMKQHRIIDQELDFPYLCPAHTRELTEWRDERRQNKNEHKRER
jgi:hypothetical protein